MLKLLFRSIRRDWEIYSLQFITLAVALATAIVVISFSYHEFTRGNEFDKNVVRILRKNETKEYEGRNRLSNRIPDEVYKHFPGATRSEDLSVYATITTDLETAEAQLNRQYADSSFTYKLQPTREIYFGPRVIGENAHHGEVNCVLILTSISMLILVLAATNFVNLVSLTLPDRSKEIAIRKVAGANRPGLLALMAKETFIIVFISLLIGIGILIATPDDVTSISNIPTAPVFIVLLLVVVIAVAPLFPAWAFVKATPGRLLSTDTITFPRMKKAITFIQLGISISLIIASLVIDRQISRSLIKEPGKNHEQIVYTKWPQGMSRQYLNRLKNDWPRDNANIVDLTAVSHTPDNINSKPVGEDYYQLGVDYDFKDFFRLEMAECRWFGPMDYDSVVVNEAASGANALGVVKDFSNDKPVHFSINEDESNFILIRVIEVDIRKTLNTIARSFSEISGRHTNISFLDHNYAETLAYEDRLNQFSSLLAIVSGIIACCSIYALSLSRMNDNVKQIAIRKTFGASDSQIVGRLSYQFLELMLASLFFFGPVTYFLLREWLRNFAYAAKFSWSDPLVSIGICLVIVGVTNVIMLMRINTNSLKDLLRR
jgi:putative ABC transport system permease protein